MKDHHIWHVYPTHEEYQRYRQRRTTAILVPVGALVLTMLQWTLFFAAIGYVP